MVTACVFICAISVTNLADLLMCGSLNRESGVALFKVISFMSYSLLFIFSEVPTAIYLGMKIL